MNAPLTHAIDGIGSRRSLPSESAAEVRELFEEYQASLAELERLTFKLNRLDHARTSVLAQLSTLSDQIAILDDHADHGALMHRSTAAEVALVTRTGHLSATHRMTHASTLHASYPNTAHALLNGALSLAHTEVIVSAGTIITTSEARRHYEAAVLPLASEMTAHQLKPHAKRLAEVHADRTIDERYEDARNGRDLRITNLDDGMAKLTATLGAVEAHAIKDRLSRIARVVRQEELRGPDETNTRDSSAQPQEPPAQTDPRTHTQVEVDVFVELLLTGGCNEAAAQLPHSASATFARLAASAGSRSTGTGDPLSAITGRVQVSVPVFTLAELHDPKITPYLSPAELAGYGPIPLSVAMRLAGHSSSWSRVMTHPISGAVLAVDRYQPSNDLRQFLGARDQHCRFVGCTVRLDRCDIDHTVAYSEGGKTSPRNTGHLCRRHHVLKHWKFIAQSGWHPTQAEGGVYTWRAPSGRRYRERPKSSVRFEPHHSAPEAQAAGPPGF